MATAEISKFAGILKAALSQHPLSHSIIFQDLKSFRFWNSWNSVTSTNFVVMLPKSHLTLHSWMYGSEWSHHHGYMDHEELFVWFFCVFLHLFLILSASFRSISFLPYIVTIFAWNVPLVSLIFLKRSLAFPILLFSSISLHWSLKKAFLSLLAILWNSAFRWVYLSFSPLPLASVLFSAILKASSENHFSWG